MDVYSADTCGRRGVRPLLLLWLFVVKAAADCPKPEGKETMVLTNEALLLNAFPEGSVASLECANGYIEDSGSGRMTCTAGEWTTPDLICIKKDCGPPRVLPNMIIDTKDGTLFGAVAEVSCEKGYQLSGVSYKQCYVTGWSGRSRCELVTCDKPGEVTNGRNTWNSSAYPEYGEVIRYTCDEGYVLIGKDAITCSETGEYDSQPPECKRVTIEDRVTTETITSTPPTQEASTSTDSPGTSTAHSAKTFTTSTTTTPGGRGIMMADERATTASVTSTSLSSFQDKHGVDVDTKEHIGHAPVIISVIAVVLVACIVIAILYKYLLRRKGSTNGTAPICA